MNEISLHVLDAAVVSHQCKLSSTFKSIDRKNEFRSLCRSSWNKNEELALMSASSTNASEKHMAQIRMVGM